MPIPLALTEAAIQAAVLQHWRTLGVPGTLVAAIPNAGALGQPGLTAGLADLLVLGGVVRVAFIELKTATGRTSPKQHAFRERCRILAIPCAITYGRDEPIAQLEAWGIVRPMTVSQHVAAREARHREARSVPF